MWLLTKTIKDKATTIHVCYKTSQPLTMAASLIGKLCSQ